MFAPRKLTRQPVGGARIDWNNPLTRSLIVASTPTNGYNEIVSNLKPTAAVGSLLTVVSTGRGLAWLPGAQAKAGIEYNTGKNSPFIRPSTAETWNDHTFLVIAAPRTNAIKSAINVRSASIDLSSAFFNFNYDGASDGYSSGKLSMMDYFGGINWHAEAASAITGNMEVYAGSKEGNGGRLYRNGVPLTTTVAGGTPNPVTQTDTTIGIGHMGGYTGSGIYFDDPLVLALGWNRALSAAEHAALGRNPWQVFRTQRSYIAPVRLASVVVQPRRTWISA